MGPKPKKPIKYEKPPGISQRLEISTLDKCWHKFRIADDRTYLLGHFSETHRRYTYRSNGYQTPCNCIMAIAYANFIPMKDWDSFLIDKILDQGDQLYHNSIKYFSCRTKTVIKLCQVYDTFYYENLRVTMTLKGEKFRGKLFKDIYGTPHLDNVIKDFFNDFQKGIINTQGKFMAFWMSGNSIYYFDPKEHTKNTHPWNGVPGYGYALVMKLPNATALVDIIHENINPDKNSKFMITPCDILRTVKVNTIAPDVKEMKLRHCEDNVPSELEMSPAKRAPKRRERDEDEDSEVEVVKKEVVVKVVELQAKTFNQPAAADEYAPEGTAAAERKITDSMIPIERAKAESVCYFQSIVEDKIGILRATTHQSDARFTKIENGLQTLANAFAALTMLRFHKSKFWLKKMIDEILLLGEVVYAETAKLLPAGKIQRVTNICKKITFKGQDFSPEVDEYATLGKLLSKKDDVLDLLPALEEFFLNHNLCIITGPLSLALWFEDGYFFMFDPNERDHNGLRILKTIQAGSKIEMLEFTPGTACVMWFTSLKDLVEVYMNNVEKELKRDPFILNRIEIKDYAPEEEVWFNFKPLSLGKWILCGTFNQNDRRFDKETRNTQCTAMACVALGYLKVKPFKEWNRDDVDEILINGDNLYKKSVENLKALAKFYDPKLLVDEVLKRFPLEGREICLDIEDCLINGLLDAKDENDTYNLKRGLREFFRDFETGIVSSRSISVAVFRNNGMYYYFDSHSRDEKGIVNNFGTACVLRTSDTDELTKCIETNLPPGKNNLFNITMVGVKVWELSDDGAVKPPLKNYKSLGDNAAILRSSLSNRSPEFKLNRGKQTIPMCLAGAAMAKLYLPDDWTRDIVDEILYVGDKLYTDTMVEREKTPNLSEENDIDEVYAENCLMTFFIGVNKFDLSYKATNEGNFAYDFKNLIDDYFNEPLEDEYDQKQALIASDVYNVVIWVHNGLYYLFDPNPRDSTGQSFGKEEWTLKIEEDGEEGGETGENASASSASATKDATVGSQTTESVSGETSTTGATSGAPSTAGAASVTGKHSAHYWRQLEEAGGKSLVMWFTSLDALKQHIVENVPPTKRSEIIYKMCPLNMGNKPALKEVFDPVSSGQRPDNYAGDWYKFKEIDHGRWILRASYDYTYSMFPEHNRGKQELAMAYIAIGYAYHYDYSTFKTQSVNDILKYGDRLFSATRNLRRTELKKTAKLPYTEDELNTIINVQVLGIEDIARIFCIGKDQTHLDVTQNKMIGDASARDTDEVINVKRALQTYLNDNRFGVLSAKGVTVALWKGATVYYMFDPQSRGPSGIKCVNGEACITRYLSLDTLVDVFNQNLPKEGNNRFVVHQVSVRVVPCPKEFVSEEPELEEPKFDSFSKVMPGKRIISGTINQDDPKFARGTNAQCAAIALVALTMTLIHKASLWTKPMIDDIVILGDELYIESIDSLGYEYNPWEQSLTLALVKRDYTVGYMKANFQTRTMDQRGIIDIKHPKILNLRAGIDRFFDENTHGVIESEALTVAIWEEEDLDPPCIYMFDPNPRGPAGMSQIGGAACVLTFESTKLLADHFIANIANPEHRKREFLITPVEIVVGSKRGGGQKCHDPCAGSREAKLPKICPNECEKNTLRRLIEEKKKRGQQSGDESKAQKMENVGRHAYFDLPNGIAILRGTRSQNSTRYSENSRGNQDIPNCVAAFVVNRLVPVYFWHYKHIDMILDIGDTLYQDSYITYSPKEPKLGFQNVLRKVFIKDVKVSLKFYKPAITNVLNAFNLEIALMNYFQQETFAILSTLDEHVAVFFKRGMFFIFDPHPRNIEGGVCACGLAVLMRFPDLPILAEKYTENVMKLVENMGGSTTLPMFSITLVTIGKTIKMMDDFR